MKSKLRILHVIGGGEFGGAEQHILNLLGSLPKDEAEASVACFYDSVFARKLREAGVPVHALDQYGRFDLRLMRGLREVLSQVQPDIVHTHGVKANFAGRLATRNGTYKLITTVHSNLRYDYVNPFAYLVASTMERSTRRWNHHYIAVSQAIQHILQQDGIDDKQISLIYNGMNLTPFRHREVRDEHRERLRREWQIPDNCFLFGTVARFVPVKGLTYLLEAFAQVSANDTDQRYRLVLVGDGPERTPLEQKASALGIGERVHFTGFRQDIPDCLPAFDAFVHSSLYEGLGYTLIEAMASEVPVIATNVGGVGEIVSANETGLLVPARSADALAEAMRRLANNPDLRSHLVEQADQHVQEAFTIEQMAVQTLELYKSMLRNNL